jgi:uncharacterized protein (TIGR02996 family)
MTPDELAFYKRMSADPDDDLPRLAFADWLDEHGLADRAEFVRLQIDRVRNHPSDPPSARERELLDAHRADWLTEVPPGFRDGAEFARGFVAKVQCDATALLTRPTPVVVAPVEDMTIVVTALDLSMELVTPPPLTLPLKALTVQCEPFVGHAVAMYLERFGPQYPRLERLTIRDIGFSDYGVRMTTPALFPRLTALDLCHCGITDAGADILIASPWPGRLTELRLDDNRWITPPKLARLRAAFGPALVG